MQFRTQEELLRYLGKSNDRNLIKRMMERGEVWKENGMYCFVEEEEKSDQPNAKNFEDTAEILKLKDEVARLREENEALKRIEKLKEKSDTNPDELEEAKIQWEYWEKCANERAELMEKIIHETYVIAKAKLGNKMEDESEFRSSIIRKAKNID